MYKAGGLSTTPPRLLTGCEGITNSQNHKEYLSVPDTKDVFTIPFLCPSVGSCCLSSLLLSTSLLGVFLSGSFLFIQDP